VKQKFRYFVELWLFDNRMNSSNQTSCRSIIIAKKYYLHDRLIDFYASDDISYCFLTFYILQAEAPQKLWGLG